MINIAKNLGFKNLLTSTKAKESLSLLDGLERSDGAKPTSRPALSRQKGSRELDQLKGKSTRTFTAGSAKNLLKSAFTSGSAKTVAVDVPRKRQQLNAATMESASLPATPSQISSLADRYQALRAVSEQPVYPTSLSEAERLTRRIFAE